MRVSFIVFILLHLLQNSVCDFVAVHLVRTETAGIHPARRKVEVVDKHFLREEEHRGFEVLLIAVDCSAGVVQIAHMRDRRCDFDFLDMVS